MKTALITGAYRGLGFEVARQLSERGWKTILTARKPTQGAEAAAKLKNASFLELRVSQAFIPHLLKSPAGRIVNVSSGAGQLSDMGTWSPAYSASKTTLNAITCLFAAALKEKGIAVNSVCPGWCRTEMGGSEAPRSAEEGAAGIVWLAADAPQSKTGLLWRDKKVIPW